MRIRKRKDPLPFSSLSPLPLSDPCFARFPPPVQHLLANSDHPLPVPPPSADPPPPDHGINLDASPGCSLPAVFPPSISPVTALNYLKPGGEDIDREKIRDGERRNDFRGKCLVPAQVVSGDRSLPASAAAASSSSSSLGQDEKVFPVNKRPWGCLELVSSSDNQEPVEAIDNYIEHDRDDQKEGSNNITIATCTNGARKRGRGGALMVGSRCSRVNGRGWRCCQPTLVGYSLCEHHLGKGRLRSMTTVRVGATQKKEKQRPALSPAPAADHAETAPNGSHEEVEGFVITKPPRRRSSTTKLGVVKARSLSSLLDETTTATKQVVPILLEENKQEN